MRVDDYLTGKAAAAWPGAIVFEEAGRFVLRLAKPRPRDVVLDASRSAPARRFTAARRALYALIEHARAAAE